MTYIFIEFYFLNLPEIPLNYWRTQEKCWEKVLKIDPYNIEIWLIKDIW